MSPDVVGSGKAVTTAVRDQPPRLLHPGPCHHSPSHRYQKSTPHSLTDVLSYDAKASENERRRDSQSDHIKTLRYTKQGKGTIVRDKDPAILRKTDSSVQAKAGNITEAERTARHLLEIREGDRKASSDRIMALTSYRWSLAWLCTQIVTGQPTQILV